MSPRRTLLVLLVALLAAAAASPAPDPSARTTSASPGLLDWNFNWWGSGSEEQLEDDNREEQVEKDVYGGKYDSVQVNLDLTSYDYQEGCERLSEARWQWLMAGAPPEGPEEENLWTQEAGLADTAHSNEELLRNFDATAQEPGAPQPVRDGLQYGTHPGYFLLPKQQYIEKLNYSRAARRALAGVQVPCSDPPKSDCHMTLPVVKRVLAQSGDPAQQLRAWQGVQAALRPLASDFSAQTQLWDAAASANGHLSDTAEERVSVFWEALQDPDEMVEATYSRMRDLWAQVRPLHRKMAAFVRARLAAVYGDAALHAGEAAEGDERPLPAHLIGSLTGEDWSSLADIVYPDETLRGIDAALKKKGLTGRRQMEVALNLLDEELVVNADRKEILLRVRFDGQCPPVVNTTCATGLPRVLTCAGGGWQRFGEAHEVMTSLAYADVGAREDQKNTLRIATRYSALTDAMPGLVRLLALHPDHLQALEVLPAVEDSSDEDVDPEEEQVAALLLLPALRSLPRIAFAAAVDEFRLRLVNATHHKGTFDAVDVDPVATWAQVRREFQLLGGEGDVSWLTDEHVVAGEPLLGRFIAEILVYQLLDKMAPYDLRHPLRTIQIGEILKQGRSRRWSELINDEYDINDIRAEPLLTYFEPLEAVLDKLGAGAVAATPRAAVDLQPPPPPAPPAPVKAVVFEGEVPPDELPGKEETSGKLEESSPPPPNDSPSTPEVEAASAGAAPASTETPPEPSTASARSAVLAVSLCIFGVALVAGAIFGGRHLLRRRRKYERNRRPAEAEAPTEAPAGAGADGATVTTPALAPVLVPDADAPTTPPAANGDADPA